MDKNDLIMDIINIIEKDLSSNIKVEGNRIIIMKNGYCILPAIIHDDYVMLYDEGQTGEYPIIQYRYL